MKRYIIPILLGSLFVLAGNEARAQILLQIDVSIPSAVTITATGAIPNAASNTVQFGDGVTLVGFFKDSTGEIANSLGGNLSAAALTNESKVFDVYYSSYYNSADYQYYDDLRIWGSGISDTMVYDLVNPAFSGTATVDLSTVSAFLPDVGAMGMIWTNFTDGVSDTTNLGTWQVVGVPEPSTYAALFGLAALGFVAWRRRRASA